MDPRRLALVALAALTLAAMPAAAQQKPEPSFPEQVIEGVKGFFRQIFGGEAERPPTLGGEEPKDSAKAEAPPKPAAAPVQEPVKPSPTAQAEPDSLHALVARGDFQTASKMIAEGADVEAKHPGTGASVLHYAVMRGNPEILDLLLSRGVDVNSRTKNGTTPLHTAVLYNRYEVAEKLIAKGAEVNAQSASGATPLALASAAKNRTIAELLRDKGAK